MRTTDKDFRQFISISRGSCAELETQTTIAYKLGYIKEEDFYNLLTSKIEEVERCCPLFMQNYEGMQTNKPES